MHSTVRQRDLQAEVTRERILEVAAEEMYRVGYQAASIGEILKKLGMSKGGFYHHFPTKQALGYAVLDELFAKLVAKYWDEPLAADQPLVAVIELLKWSGTVLAGENLQYGCPINNLAQEMSPLDEGFRQRVEAVYRDWHNRLTQALERAQHGGQMRADADAACVAAFVIATKQGATGLAKNAQNNQVYVEAISCLIDYLEQLVLAP